MEKQLTIFTILYFYLCSMGFGLGIKQCTERMMNEAKKGNTETALKNAEKAFFKIKKEERIDKNNLANLKSIGDFYFDSKKYNNSIEVYSFLCEENKKAFGENSSEFTASLFSLTRSYEFLKDFLTANNYYKKLIEIYKILLSKEDKEYLFTLDDYARFNLKFKKYTVAKKYFSECLEGYKIVFGEKSERVGWTLNNLGTVSFWNDAPFEAENYYEAALDIYRTINSSNTKEYILTLKNLIEFYKASDDFAKAEPYIEELYNILVTSKGVNTLEFAAFLDNIFIFYLRLGQNEKAMMIWDKAFSIRKLLVGGESIEVAKSLYNLGLGHIEQDNFESAKSELNSALIIATKILPPQNTELIEYKEGLAEAYRGLGDYDSTQEIYSQLLNDYGNFYKYNPYRNAILNNNMGSFWEDMGYFDRAESSYLYAYSIVEKEKLQSNDYEIISLFNISILYSRMKQFEKAEVYIYKAYNLISKRIQNNLSYFNEKNRVELLDYIKPRLDYLTAYSIEYSKQKPEILKLTVAVNLLFKSLLFDESTRMRRVIDNSDNKDLKELYFKMIAKRESLSTFYSLTPDIIKEKNIDVEKIEEEADSLEKKIAFISTQYKNNITTQNISYNDLVQALKSNEAAVEFMSYYDLDTTGQMNEKHYGALILKHNLNEPIFVALGTEDEMQHYTYANYINSILSKENDYETYKSTWGKFETYLNSITTIYISNEGVFNKINHSTIFCPETNNYLSEKYDISILLSLREIVNKTGSKVNFYNAFLFGNPKYDLEDTIASAEQGSIAMMKRIVKDGKVANLPATKDEIKNIENIFNKKKFSVKIFSEKLATKKMFLSISNPSIIHIATHGFFVPDDSSNIFLTDIQKQKAAYNPYLKCGLLFAGCDPYITARKKVNSTEMDNGIVTAFDVLNMDLTNTDLVILSACQTGLGESRDGEAMYSLQKAFQIAGAKSVITSLWNVSDNATQILMTKFYENLLLGKNKKDSLTEAQKYLIAKTAYKLPYYWGAFVLVGF